MRSSCFQKPLQYSAAQRPVNFSDWLINQETEMLEIIESVQESLLTRHARVSSESLDIFCVGLLVRGYSGICILS